ncbi:hypothetical protein DENSPDRAFT_832936 [Dentipellis sp. KUC8613]|nr:hypothetical protein DENSPDRAFT_832936 [Dentipellis sp. KUC8613]
MQISERIKHQSRKLMFSLSPPRSVDLLVALASQQPSKTLPHALSTLSTSTTSSQNGQYTITGLVTISLASIFALHFFGLAGSDIIRRVLVSQLIRALYLRCCRAGFH